MKKLENYKPFDNIEYVIENDNGKRYFLFNNLKLELSPNGYIPKSGVLFNKVLNKNNCKNKDVLDLGCGYLGILGLTAYIYGAKKIDSIDFDEKCVNWFNRIIINNKLNNINCFFSNWFSNINKKYDLILTNPPIMPMLNGEVHDTGGKGGRDCILYILNNAYKYLNENGKLYLLVFDFLGTFTKTNNDLTIKEIAKNIGYKNIKKELSVKKVIKKGSVTYNNLTYIKHIYPLYDFERYKDLSCQIEIISMEW